MPTHPGVCAAVGACSCAVRETAAAPWRPPLADCGRTGTHAAALQALTVARRVNTRGLCGGEQRRRAGALCGFKPRHRA